MAENTTFIKLLAAACIHFVLFIGSTGLLCRNPSNPGKMEHYNSTFICCNGTRYIKSDELGRTRDCCGNHLIYTEYCECDRETHQIKPIHPATSEDLCKVEVNDKSPPDSMNGFPSPSKMRAITGDKGCHNTDQKYCNDAKTCFNPTRQICCPNGIFSEISVCPSQKSNTKFCSDNNFKSKACPKKYKHAFSVVMGEIIFEDSSYTVFPVKVKEITYGASCRRRGGVWNENLTLEINRTSCYLPGSKFTVLSKGKIILKNTPFIYLNKDDLVLSRKLRRKCLNDLYKACSSGSTSIPGIGGGTEKSKSGTTQHIHVTLLLMYGFSLRII